MRKLITKLLISVLFIFTNSIYAQTVETESAQAGWVLGFGPYSGASVADETANGVTGRKPGTTSLRAMYITRANSGVAAGTYSVDIRWCDDNTESTSQAWLQVGQRTCYGTSTTVCHTGTFGIDDTWLADQTDNTCYTRNTPSITVNTNDTIFIYWKFNGSGSNRLLIDYIRFTSGINTAPEFTDPDNPDVYTVSLDECSAVGSTVVDLNANDTEGNTLTYTITSGNGDSKFAINSSTGVITVNSAVDFEILSSYSLGIRVTDNGTGSLFDDGTVNITVTDCNNENSPVNANQSFSIAENSSGRALVGYKTASDADGQSITYSIISGNTGTAFNIDAVTGRIYVENILDFETLSSYSIVIRATDNGTPTKSTDATVTITVTNIVETSTTMTLFASPCIGGNTVNITATLGSDAHFIGWTNLTQGGTTGITSPTSKNTTFTWDGLIDITLRATYGTTTGASRISNGDFEAGGEPNDPAPSGFTSTYDYKDGDNGNSVQGPGEYGVTEQARQEQADAGDNQYFLTTLPHEGSYMLYADGSTALTDIYATTISVTIGKSYVFWAWVANGHDGSETSAGSAEMEFRINGVLYGTLDLVVNSAWQQFSCVYTATATNAALPISIRNANTNGTRNDFFMDQVEVYELTNFVSSPDLLIEDCPTFPLPVTWSDFKGERSNNNNVLTWITGSEKNNDYFIVESSCDGINFKPIGRVEGSENTITKTKYTFNDDQTICENIYYRIQQVDFNGEYEYSKIIYVSLNKSIIFQNPNNGSFTIYIGHKYVYKLDVVDMLGKIVFTKTGTGNVDVYNLSNGVYNITLDTGNGVFLTKKLVVY